MSISDDMPVSPNEKQLDIIFYYGAYPLWKYLDKKFNIDIRDVCHRVAIDEPVLHQLNGVYTMRIVDNEYDHNLDETHNENISFLLNCINSVFKMLKEGIIKNGEHILAPYHFQLDDNRNLELVLIDDPANQNYVESIDDNIKIGVILLANGSL